MACPHPREERQRVYQGRDAPLSDRDWCALCGEVVYRESRPIAGENAPATAQATDTAASSSWISSR